MKINVNDLKNHDVNYRQNRKFVNQEFIDNIKSCGQLTPVKVVDINGTYHVVDGWRRVLACKALGVEVNCEVVPNNINNILFDFGEVSRRSDYEQFVVLKYLENKLKVDRVSIGKQLNISRDRVYNLFAFGDLKEELVKAIGDFKMVTSSTAKELKNIQKSKSCLAILIELADEIRLGLGASKLRAEVRKQCETKNSTAVRNEVLFSNDGAVIGTYRGDRQFTFETAVVNEYGADTLKQAIKGMFEELKKSKVIAA